MPYFGAKDFYVGYGWYRKHLAIPLEWDRKRIFLESEGAFQDAITGLPEKQAAAVDEVKVFTGPTR